MVRTPTVFVVDDDQEFREASRWLLESEGLEVETYPSAEAFLASYDSDRPGCLLVDVCMQGMSGLELQEALAGRAARLPVILLTGHGDVPTAVKAIKAGGVDFLQKPVSDAVLLDRIRYAIELDAEYRRERDRRSEFSARLALLTPREREVLDLVVAAKANKQIAVELGVSEKTVEVHRKRVMRKLRAKSAVDLVRNVLTTAAAWRRTRSAQRATRSRVASGRGALRACRVNAAPARGRRRK